MNRVKAFIHFIILCILVMGLVVTPINIQKGYAAYTYKFDDTSTSSQLKGSETKIFEQYMVWRSNDANGDRQIFYQNLQTGTEAQVTAIASPKESPNVGVTSQGQPIVIWADKRNYNSLDPIWDIYSYNTVTEKETKLNSGQGQFVSPSIHGDYVVWHDLTSRDMYVYNLSTGQETLLGKGRYPVVAKAKVLYQNHEDGGLSVYDIRTQETKRVVELPYHEFVYAFTFNGETALWAKTNLDHVVTYSTANLAAQEITVKDLTTPKKQQVQYPDMIIGDQFGAWLEQRNGVTQIVGADLYNNQTYQITNSGSNQKLYAFYGDRLILGGEQGNLIYRQITAVPSTNTGTGTSQPPSSSPTSQNQKKFGPEGGSIEIKDHLYLEIPKGTFTKESLVSIREQKAASSPNRVLLSKAWEISSELPFGQEVTLVMHFDLTKIVPQQMKKVAIYSYNNATSTWEYVGGVADQKTGTVTTQIKQPGLYAVMLYDKTFTDIQGHWAQHSIETLASRFIVNGVSEQQFAPNRSVTRAEFAKMLASSLGLDPVEATAATFTDVPGSHWALGWIEAAYQAGIIEGSQGRFHPNATITREEMMTMLVRALQLGESDTTLDTLQAFKDSHTVSQWAKMYVALAIEHGLIEGANGQINPSDASTRAMAAVVMYRVLEKEKKL